MISLVWYWIHEHLSCQLLNRSWSWSRTRRRWRFRILDIFLAWTRFAFGGRLFAWRRRRSSRRAWQSRPPCCRFPALAWRKRDRGSTSFLLRIYTWIRAVWEVIQTLHWCSKRQLMSLWWVINVCHIKQKRRVGNSIKRKLTIYRVLPSRSTVVFTKAKLRNRVK